MPALKAAGVQRHALYTQYLLLLSLRRGTNTSASCRAQSIPQGRGLRQSFKPAHQVRDLINLVIPCHELEDAASL